MRVEAFLKKHTGSLESKTVALTGSTGGLGTEICRLLLKAGASLILIDRSKEKQDALVKDLKGEFPSADVSCVVADMGNFGSVKGALSELERATIDYLILNAGAYNIPKACSDLGYNNVFQINFVSPYYLTKALLPQIKNRGGKIVAVGSIAHSYSKTDKDDIDFNKKTRCNLIYGNSKRYLMGAFFALAKKGEPVVVAHPGISFTGITNHYPKLIFAIIKRPMKIIFEKPRVACLSIFHALFHDVSENSWIGPRLFNVWGLPRVSRVGGIKSGEEEFIFNTAESIISGIDNKG